MHGNYDKCSFHWKLEGKRTLEDAGMDAMIIFEWILQKVDGSCRIFSSGSG
jgi:hypothetical protein